MNRKVDDAEFVEIIKKAITNSRTGVVGVAAKVLISTHNLEDWASGINLPEQFIRLSVVNVLGR